MRFWVTSHLASLMDTESMVCSFRRMLRGVSDGDLMLSEDLRGAVNPWENLRKTKENQGKPWKTMGKHRKTMGQHRKTVGK